MIPEIDDNDADLAMILADLSREFLEGCEDQLAMIDEQLSKLREKTVQPEHAVLEIKRHVHSMKGMGATFGYSSISLLAHALEDYFETMFEFGPNGYYDLQLYVDRIREIDDIG